LSVALIDRSTASICGVSAPIGDLFWPLDQLASSNSQAVQQMTARMSGSYVTDSTAAATATTTVLIVSAGRERRGYWVRARTKFAA